MNTQFNKPKGFGEILDFTFRLSKNRFSDFFKIFLLLMGPLYILEAIVLMAMGTSFFREDVVSGGLWYEELFSRLETEGYTGTSSLGLDAGYILILLGSIFLLPIAQASVLIAVNHIRNNEEFTVGSVIKKALKRFWAILGSSILFGLMILALVIIPILLVTFGGIFAIELNPILGVLMIVLLCLGIAVGYFYIVARWSFYFGSVTLKEGTPGFLRSWNLTKNRGWVIVGIYIIFSLIISSISSAIEISLTLFLGSSVLLTMIVNFVTLITTMIFSVGYAIMYFDLKTRHDADDIKDMLDEYTV